MLQNKVKSRKEYKKRKLYELEVQPEAIEDFQKQFKRRQLNP
jgi:hypothetical protein